MSYLRRVYRIPAHLEEALVADLWQAGTLGVESAAVPAGGSAAPGAGGPAGGGQVVPAAGQGWVRLTAYFPPAADLPEPISPLEAAGVAVCELQAELPDTDWMAEYRRRTPRFALGRSLFVDPGEPDEGDAAPLPAGRRLLRLPARMAFGTGSHESTSLAIELLEAEDLAGRTVLDVGTGTGILAFAALLWGAAAAVGFDVDPVAVFQARINRRLNGLHPQLFAGRAAALGAARRFDVAVVNVVPEQALPELGDMVRALAGDGVLILSGLLAERAPDVLAHFAACGLGETARRQAGDWLALRLARDGGQPLAATSDAAGGAAGGA